MMSWKMEEISCFVRSICQNLKDMQFTVMYDTENHQILTFTSKFPSIIKQSANRCSPKYN